jgi:hypothetical protein
MRNAIQATKVMVGMVVSFMILSLSGSAIAQTTFFEDFNRPDGLVGNGWLTWHGAANNSPDIAIQGGQLLTLGANALEGGIYRDLPVTLPVSFSFQFRTGQPPLGGWDIRLNAAPVTDATQLDPDRAQVRFLQYQGSGGIDEIYTNASGGQSDQNAFAAGARDYGTSVLTTISGTVNADLSATITVTYMDGILPDTIVYVFPAPAGIASSPPGSLFILSNSSAFTGPHFFDNVSITYGGLPSVSISSPAAGTYLLNQPVAANYSCSGGSGVSTCTGPVPSGSNIDTATVGNKSFTVDAIDTAGATATQSVNYSVAFAAGALYDQSKARQSGSTYPIKVQLADAAGVNVSASTITVHATSTAQLSGTPTGLLDDSGAANPDYDFRYDASLGGYIFNLSLKGYLPGVYAIHFRAGSDPTDHSLQFQVR